MLNNRLKISPFILILISMIIFSYLIGHFVVKPRTEFLETQKDTPDFQNGSVLTNMEESFKYTGFSKVVDNPWGVNIGIIDTDDYGKAIFLTPNTSLKISTKLDGSNKRFIFSYGLHPWVIGKSSDGSDIIIEIYSVNQEDKKFTKKLFTGSDIKQQKEEIDLSNYSNQDITIKISCDNGTNNNSENDWVIITNALIK